MSGRNFTKPAMHIILFACSIAILMLYKSIQSSPVAAESPAFIRVVHASPDVGTVDVFMDGKKLLSSFQYASVSNYLPLPSGPHTIKVALIGKGIDAPVVTQTLPINSGEVYTIAAVGMQSTKSLSLKVFKDDNTVAGNVAKVRVYHLSPGTGSVDITEGMHTVAGNVTYEQASSYVSIPAGLYTFNATVTPTNTSIPISTQLNQWTVTSLFAIGLLNSNPRLKFVTTQTTGIPALPQTGGGPVASSGEAQHPITWPLMLLACLLVLAIMSSCLWIREWLNTKRK